MNILIQKGNMYDPDTTGIANALSDIGYRVTIWSDKVKNAFDAFNDAKPNVFISSTGLVNRAVSKCLAKNNNCKTVLFIDNDDYKDLPEVDLLMSYWPFDEEKYNAKVTRQISPSINMNVSTKPTTDFHMYSEILYIGNYNYSPELRLLINKHIIPLADDFRLRIYGPGDWPIPQALGILNYGNVNNALYNTDVYIFLSQEDYQLSWNPYSAVCVGTPVLTNNKVLLERFGEHIPSLIYKIGRDDISDIISKSKIHKQERIALGREFIHKHHTNYTTANNLLNDLGIDKSQELQAALLKRQNNE